MYEKIVVHGEKELCRKITYCLIYLYNLQTIILKLQLFFFCLYCLKNFEMETRKMFSLKAFVIVYNVTIILFALQVNKLNIIILCTESYHPSQRDYFSVRIFQHLQIKYENVGKF